ncbi:MAG TPA: WYL domain-containing protein, partial [Draconibacterium sp.]|nr:WYL domain-containing protein [Draconibacterium sp.]
MSKRESITRYNLIINKLRKQPSTFAQISDYLKLESEIQSYNFNISKRTFQRDLQDILSIFNIEIKYNFTDKVYFIKYDERPEISERVLEAFDTFNALNISDRISRNIYFEKRRPAGTENLYGLL